MSQQENTSLKPEVAEMPLEFRQVGQFARIRKGLTRFVRAKPLGAAGGVIIVGLVLVALFAPAMWFHKSCLVDQWMLFAYDSPRASGARGFATGRIFSREGVLIASMSQEGLMRLRN